MIKFLQILAFILVIVGALNWGLIGILDFNLVNYLFGEMSIISRIIYCLVAFSGILLIFLTPQCYAND